MLHLCYCLTPEVDGEIFHRSAHMSGSPSLPSCDSSHLAAQVGMLCGFPIFPSCMPPRYNCHGPSVLRQSLGVSFWPVPCVGPRLFLPLSCSSWVQSRWSFHQFRVGSSDIDFTYSICGGNSLSSPCRNFPWVCRLPRKHRAIFPLEAVLTHCAAELAVGRSGLWWIALPAVGFACDPSGFLLILGSACGHLSMWSVARSGSSRCGCS